VALASGYFRHDPRPHMKPDRFLIENKLWMITAPIDVPVYDFSFRDLFECIAFRETITRSARADGAAGDSAELRQPVRTA
jgi:hypothetical protein